MKAIVFRSVDQLPLLEDIDVVNDKHVTVDLTAAALNHRDLWITKGLYPGLVPGTVMGSDGCGYIDGRRVIINPSVAWGNREDYQSKEFRVLGVPDHGTFADRIHVYNNQVYDVPRHLSDEEAAALPVAGTTAYRALVSRCKLQAGENVLITGIGGGVAMMAALFAKALGAHVYFTSGSDQKVEAAMKLGLKFGVNYNSESWADQLMKASGGFDVIIDSAAGDGFASLIKLCNFGARLAFYGGTKGKINGLNPQIIFWKQLSIYGSTMGSDSDFAAMLELVAKHQLRPVIDTVWPIADFKGALERMASSSQFGKIILKIK